MDFMELEALVLGLDARLQRLEDIATAKRKTPMSALVRERLVSVVIGLLLTMAIKAVFNMTSPGLVGEGASGYSPGKGVFMGILEIIVGSILQIDALRQLVPPFVFLIAGLVGLGKILKEDAATPKIVEGRVVRPALIDIELIPVILTATAIAIAGLYLFFNSAGMGLSVRVIYVALGGFGGGGMASALAKGLYDDLHGVAKHIEKKKEGQS
jgi:hypothetical protein